LKKGKINIYKKLKISIYKNGKRKRGNICKLTTKGLYSEYKQGEFVVMVSGMGEQYTQHVALKLGKIYTYLRKKQRPKNRGLEGEFVVIEN
jgi:hypothetical protein